LPRKSRDKMIVFDIQSVTFAGDLQVGGVLGQFRVRISVEDEMLGLAVARYVRQKNQPTKTLLVAIHFAVDLTWNLLQFAVPLIHTHLTVQIFRLFVMKTNE